MSRLNSEASSALDTHLNDRISQAVFIPNRQDISATNQAAAHKYPNKKAFVSSLIVLSLHAY